MSDLFGIPVHTSPDLRVDQGYLVRTATHAAGQRLVVGTRRLTDAELAGHWARWFVRKGFDDAGLLPTGIKVGREPNRDTVGILAQLHAEVPR